MRPKTILLLLLLLTLLLCYIIDPAQYVWVPKCPFKLLTGWSCPGCGIQRAAHAVLHGDFQTAIQYNWFLVLSLPYAFLLVTAQWLVKPAIKEKMMRVLGSRCAVYTYITLFFIWWFVRNLLGI